MHSMHGCRVTPTHELMRKWRERLRLTQEELGERVGMEQYTISRIETGSQEVSASNLERIVQAMGLTMTRFYRGAA